MAALDALGRQAKRTGLGTDDARERGFEVLDQTMTFIGAGVAALAERTRR